MKQFFKGSPIISFFYITVSMFASMSCAILARISAKSAYYDAINNHGIASDAGGSKVDKLALLAIYGAIGLLLLVNIFSVTGHWIREKRSEIRARMLSGGSQRRVCGQMILNYSAIVMIASIIGVVLAGAILSLGVLVVETAFFFNSLTQIALSVLLLSATGTIISAFVISHRVNSFDGR